MSDPPEPPSAKKNVLSPCVTIVGAVEERGRFPDEG